jgi:hypothetical protein
VDDPDNYRPEKSLSRLPAGALGRPFGESVVIQGKVVEGPFKHESWLTQGRLLVQRINGVATQQGVVIRFNPLTTRQWWMDLPNPTGEELWRAQERKLKGMKGKSFEMRGDELGEHTGMTTEEFLLQPPVQTRGFHFQIRFQPLMMKENPPVSFVPADFVGRVAEFEGRAQSRAGKSLLVSDAGWKLIVRDGNWPGSFESREVWVKGRVGRKENGVYRLEQPDARLLLLADQLGQEVRLDGVAWALNDYWWFEYRGEKLYVDNQRELPGWNHNLWSRPVTISGRLDRALLPDLDQISLKEDRDLREYYIVRRPSWVSLDESWRKPLSIPKAPRLTLD